mmetsp:Transcript_84096/g.238258  ORF Transcript_84096/g.238258 Transcript_84096/m.238258 type:complete len:406 (+) Transcript_84096:1096-2313(+)
MRLHRSLADRMSTTWAARTWGGGHTATVGGTPSEGMVEKCPQRSPAVLHTLTSFAESMLTSAGGEPAETSEATDPRWAGQAPTTFSKSGRGFGSAASSFGGWANQRLRVPRRCRVPAAALWRWPLGSSLPACCCDSASAAEAARSMHQIHPPESPIQARLQASATAALATFKTGVRGRTASRRQMASPSSPSVSLSSSLSDASPGSPEAAAALPPPCVTKAAVPPMLPASNTPPAGEPAPIALAACAAASAAALGPSGGCRSSACSGQRSCPPSVASAVICTGSLLPSRLMAGGVGLPNAAANSAARFRLAAASASRASAAGRQSLSRSRPPSSSSLSSVSLPLWGCTLKPQSSILEWMSTVSRERGRPGEAAIASSRAWARAAPGPPSPRGLAIEPASRRLSCL